MHPDLQEQFARIKERYEIEKTASIVVREAHEIPFSYDLISSEWLTEVICRNVPGANITSHSLSAVDDGTSNRRKIYLEYNKVGQQHELPKSVFCKASQSLSSRYQLGLNRAAETEVTFYNKVRNTVDIEAPKLVFANADSETFNSIILLENLEADVSFGNHDTIFTRTMVENQLQELIKLHATFYESERLSAELSNFNTISGFFDLCDKAISWREACKNGFAKSESVIPPALFTKAQQVHDLTPQSYHIHKSLPKTLIHGDTHPKNWYIYPDERVGLADWQLLLIGHWSRDLAYTLSSSLTIENRRAWEDELIRLYLEGMQNSCGVTVSFDETMTLYRQQLISSLAMWTGTIGANADSPEMQPEETSLEIISRITHAIDDHDALNAFY